MCFNFMSLLKKRGMILQRPLLQALEGKEEEKKNFQTLTGKLIIIN